jgi:MULE transposase domain
MYSIHGSIRGKHFPLVYSLLPNTKQETYEELFRIVKQHVQGEPKYVTIDFEKGAETAFSAVFPRCDVFGCFFHFKQAIWRNICVSSFYLGFHYLYGLFL